jgi:2-hydroxychromene-2-carboxylate isomerase
MRGVIYAQKSGIGTEYINAMYQCMWEKGLNMADPAVIQQALANVNLPAEEIVAATAEPEIKQALIENTMSTVERGTFGSPTFFVGDEIYFGKDRLTDVEEEILAQS